MKLLVRNLATATTSDKIKTLFSEYGTVQSCNLVLDQKTGKSKGFGFVEMPKVGEAKAAMQKLNGYKLAGSVIRVKKAQINKETVETVATATAPVKTEKVAKIEKIEKVEKTTEIEKEVEKVEKTNLQVEQNEMLDNENNALNIYGKIKEQDDY